MNDFATELRSLADRLRAHPTHSLVDFELGAPVTDEEVERVHQRLGFSLDERFLAYFRAANGVKLSWVGWEGDATRDQLHAEYQGLRQIAMGMAYDPGVELAGSFFLPSLDAIFHDPSETEHVWGAEYAEGQVPLLGGFEERELRESLRWIDREYLLPADDSQTYHMVGLLAHPRFPDPLCIFADDNAAALSDCHPMRARTYFDLMAATGGGAAAKKHFRFARGFARDFPIVEVSRDHFAGAGYLESEEVHGARLRELQTRRDQ